MKGKLFVFSISGDPREKKIIKNVVISFGAKGGSIFVGLILVPLTIDYINPTQYGIWMTLSSIMGWISFFDIGMGNGLRNQLTFAMAQKDYNEAKRCISSTYAFLFLISYLLFSFFWFANPWINWRSFLNIPASVTDNMSLLLLILIGTFCIQLNAQIINVVLTAIHRSAAAAFISFLGQLGILIAVLVLKFTVPASLILLTTTLTSVPIVILLIASVIVFRGELKVISPSVRHVTTLHAKKVLNLGSTFFLIQLGALVLFQTDNIIITRIIGPGAVTEFNIAYRLFSIVIMVFTILMTPYWSAFADAYAKKDFIWLKTNLKKMRRIWLFISVLVIPVLFLMSDWLYRMWIGSAVTISSGISLAMACYAIVYTGMSVSSYFLNGLGKIKVQQYLYIVGCAVNIPLSIWMTKRMGAAGAVCSNVAVLSVMMMVLWVQGNKILSGTDRGVWSR